MFLKVGVVSWGYRGGGEGRGRQKTRRKKRKVYRAQNQADLLEMAAWPLSG